MKRHCLRLTYDSYVYIPKIIKCVTSLYRNGIDLATRSIVCQGFLLQFLEKCKRGYQKQSQRIACNLRIMKHHTVTDQFDYP